MSKKYNLFMKGSAKKILVIVISILLLSLTSNLIIREHVSAGTGDFVDWTFYKVCNIADSINGYQMFLNITYASGGDVDCESHCQADFDDIRFAKDGTNTSLDYWIERKVDGEYAWVWVETPTDVESSDKIILWYGSVSADSNSSGEDTFLQFWDHDNDTSAWTTSGSMSVTESGNGLRFVEASTGDHSYAYNTNPLTTNIGTKWCFEALILSEVNSVAQNHMIITSDTGYANRWVQISLPSTDDRDKVTYRDAGTGGYTLYPNDVRGTYKIYKACCNESDTSTGQDLYLLGAYNRTVIGSALDIDTADGSPGECRYLFFGDFTFSSRCMINVTWMYFRNWTTDTEPSWDSFSNENNAGAGIQVLAFGLDSGQFTWVGDALDTVWSNATAGSGGTLEINCSVNDTVNLTEIRLWFDNLDSIGASNMSVCFSSDNSTWGTNTRAWSDGGSNVSITDALWTTGNGCYGSDPFAGAGITDKNCSIYARVKLVIPSGSSGYYDQGDWKIYYKWIY